jgi:hypothetical protein
MLTPRTAKEFLSFDNRGSLAYHAAPDA